MRAHLYAPARRPPAVQRSAEPAPRTLLTSRYFRPFRTPRPSRSATLHRYDYQSRVFRAAPSPSTTAPVIPVSPLPPATALLVASSLREAGGSSILGLLS